MTCFRVRLFPWAAILTSPALWLGATSATAADEEKQSPAAFVHPKFSAEQVEFYEKEIAPILNENCNRCHGGADAGGQIKVKSGFQIISRAGILKGGDHGPAYDAKDPASSLILKMVSYTDENRKMPPRGKLPQEQIDLLTKWIDMGMPWTPGKENVLVEVEHDDPAKSEKFKNWWSYQPIVPPDVPKVADPRWQKNPIDAFIYRDLAKAGLKPNDPAPRQVLIRRASYNLTGLGPTPKEVSDFALSRESKAWGKLVDRLLESPRYGEKWARHWLDLVRFAESNGFERDSDKPHIWRYRQYVIDAFNQDLPYDRFIMEQLAGDELDEVTTESMIATGYHRIMQWDDEPADRKQYPFDVLDDNVRTTSEVFLGMTLGCARCHDHKGEPISQKDYYSFMSFFNNITPFDKRTMVQNVGNAGARAVAEAENKKRKAKESKIRERIAAFEEMAKKRFAAKDPRLARQLTGGENGILVPSSREKGQEWEYTMKEPPGNWMTVGYRPTDWEKGPGGFGKNPSRHGKARTSWSTSDIWMRKTFRLTTIPSKLVLEMYHDEDAQIYINGELVKEVMGHVDAYVKYPLGAKAKKFLQTGRNVIAVHCKQTGGGQFIDLELREDLAPLRMPDLIAKRGGQVLDKREIVAYHALRKELKEALSAARKPQSQKGAGTVQAMVVQERGTKPPDMHIHIRGSFHAQGEKVDPAYPSALRPPKPEISLPKSNPKSSGRRRALAEWIASEKNPRTARVMVNRLWQMHFGTGIVPSTSDFGGLGEKPSHPELLDWLAAEFMERDWSIKAMHRLIMNSRTYVMSSKGQDAGLAKDPQNKQLWRFNMRRLSAEEIRDSVLAVSGKLNLKEGGPSFYEPLEEAVLATSSTKKGKWGNSPVEETLRRSVYMKLKRSLVPPIMQDFDVADADSSCAVRFVTTVPAQALNTLNSRFFNQQAKFLADRLEAKHPGKVESQIRSGLELALSRHIRDDEIKTSLEMMKKLETEGNLTPRQSLERFCLLVYNLNEFMYLD